MCQGFPVNHLMSLLPLLMQVPLRLTFQKVSAFQMVWVFRKMSASQKVSEFRMVLAFP